MSLARRLVESAVLPLGGTVAFLSAWPWLRAFPASTFLPLVIVAVVLGMAVPAVTAVVLRRNVWWSAGGSVLLLVLVLLGAVVREPFGFGTVARGFGEGPARLVSTTLPITTIRWVLVVPVTIVWVTSAVMGELLVRTRSRAAVVAVSFAGFGVAYAMTAGGVGELTVASAALFATAALLVCLRAWLERPRLPVTAGDTTVATMAMRPLRAGIVMVVVLGVLLAVLVPRMDVLAGAPVVPDRAPGEELGRVVTPVATFASLRRGDLGIDPSTVLFRVRTDRSSSGYLTAAHVDDYDGDAWRFTRTFEPTGGRVPVDPAKTGTVAVEQTYDVEGMGRVPGGWMAFLDRPAEVAGVEVRYDPGTGMLRPTEALRAGTSYTVRSLVSDRGLLDLATDPSAVVASSPDEGDYVVPLELQDTLDEWGELLAIQSDSVKGATIEFLAAAEQELRQHYARVDERAAATVAPGASTTAPTTAPGAPAAPPTSTGARPENVGGTSYADVAAALAANRAGTPEQFATLYALVARQLGVPARVVSGFRLTDDGRPLDATSDGRDVTAGDAWTWVEVPVVGHGWVVVDPTPGATVAPRNEQASAGTTTTTTPSQRAQTAVEGGDVGAPIAEPGDVSIPEEPTRPPYVLIGVLALLALLLLATMLATAQRAVFRWRRRRGAPTERAIGAWHETLETLERSGAAPLESLTNTEVVDVATAVDERARQPTMAVAAVANTALFWPEGVDDAQADAAWSAVREVRSAARHGAGWRRRIRGWWTLSHKV